VPNDCTLQDLGISEFLVSGRIGILNSDFGDKVIPVEGVGRKDESCKPNVSIAGFGVDAEEKGSCAGEMLGRETELELDPDSVIGNPRSAKVFKAFPKSPSFLNFNWIRRTWNGIC
jgi:hypothetical protein